MDKVYLLALKNHARSIKAYLRHYGLITLVVFGGVGYGIYHLLLHVLFHFLTLLV